MTRQIIAAFAAVLLFATAGAAQQPKHQSAANSSDIARKLVTISGTVGSAGKTFAIANDKTVWAVTNPEALLDNIGDRVSLRALVDAARHEIEVFSVGIDLAAAARLRDAAFRR